MSGHLPEVLEPMRPVLQNLQGQNEFFFEAWFKAMDRLQAPNVAIDPATIKRCLLKFFEISSSKVSGKRFTVTLMDLMTFWTYFGGRGLANCFDMVDEVYGLQLNGVRYFHMYISTDEANLALLADKNKRNEPGQFLIRFSQTHFEAGNVVLQGFPAGAETLREINENLELKNIYRFSPPNGGWILDKGMMSGNPTRVFKRLGDIAIVHADVLKFPVAPSTKAKQPYTTVDLGDDLNGGPPEDGDSGMQIDDSPVASPVVSAVQLASVSKPPASTPPVLQHTRVFFVKDVGGVGEQRRIPFASHSFEDLRNAIAAKFKKATPDEIVCLADPNGQSAFDVGDDDDVAALQDNSRLQVKFP